MKAIFLRLGIHEDGVSLPSISRRGTTFFVFKGRVKCNVHAPFIAFAAKALSFITTSWLNPWP